MDVLLQRLHGNGTNSQAVGTLALVLVKKTVELLGLMHGKIVSAEAKAGITFHLAVTEGFVKKVHGHCIEALTEQAGAPYRAALTDPKVVLGYNGRDKPEKVVAADTHAVQSK